MVRRPSVYSVRDAARRVKRDRRTIQYWLEQGMPCRRFGTHRVEIDEEVLLLWFRTKLLGQRDARFTRKGAKEPVVEPLPAFHAA